MTPDIQARIDRAEWELLRECRQSARLSAVKTVAEWATTKRKIAAGASFAAKGEHIPYNLSLTPYAKAQMEAFTDPEVMTTVLMQGADTGKTETINNCVGFCISEEPSRIIVLYPIEKSAEAWSKEHLTPMIEATPCLRNVVGEAKSRDSANTIASKRFPGGVISVIAGNSPSNFRLRRARVVIADEIDALPSSVRKEGHPITLLFKRSEGYEDSIQILSSTPGLKGQSNIENWMDLSDYNEWWVPCQSKDCGVFQTLKWKNFIWPKGQYHECRWHCEECNYRHTPAQRIKAIQQGEWRPRNPFSGIRGYFLPGFYSIFPGKKGYQSKEHQMAKDAHDAAHSNDRRETIKAWTNTFLCETYQDPEDEKPDWEVFSRRRVSLEEGGWHMGCVPLGAIRVCAGVDVQLNRLEVTVIGYGRNDECWVIRHFKVEGDPMKQDFDNLDNVWVRMERELMQPILRADKKILPVSAVGVDTSEPTTKRAAWAFVKPRQPRHWRAMRGSSLVNHQEVAPSKRSKVEWVKLWMVGTNRIKGQIYDRAFVSTPGPSHIHISAEITDEWCKQLFAESATGVIKDGVRYRQFECPKNTRNEALDCFVYANAALISLGPRDWGVLESQLKREDGEEGEGGSPVPTKPKGGPPQPRGGFVGVTNGWKI